MTKFGVFSLSQFPDQSVRQECFDNDLEFFELAEALGYDKAWIAEHRACAKGGRATYE